MKLKCTFNQCLTVILFALSCNTVHGKTGKRAPGLIPEPGIALSNRHNNVYIDHAVKAFPCIEPASAITFQLVSMVAPANCCSMGNGVMHNR